MNGMEVLEIKEKEKDWTSKKELVKYSVSTVAFMIFFGVFFYAIDLLVALLRSRI